MNSIKNIVQLFCAYFRSFKVDLYEKKQKQFGNFMYIMLLKVCYSSF